MSINVYEKSWTVFHAANCRWVQTLLNLLQSPSFSSSAKTCSQSVLVLSVDSVDDRIVSRRHISLEKWILWYCGYEEKQKKGAEAIPHLFWIWWNCIELLSCSKSLTIPIFLQYQWLNTALSGANWSFLTIEMLCYFYHSISVSYQDIHILIAVCIYSIYLIYLIHSCRDVRDIPGKRGTSVTQETETWPQDRKNRWAPKL